MNRCKQWLGEQPDRCTHTLVLAPDGIWTGDAGPVRTLEYPPPSPPSRSFVLRRTKHENGYW